MRAGGVRTPAATPGGGPGPVPTGVAHAPCCPDEGDRATVLTRGFRLQGGDAEEVRAALPLHIALFDELKVGVVHERRRLERVARSFPAQMMVSEPAELAVNDRGAEPRLSYGFGGAMDRK